MSPQKPDDGRSRRAAAKREQRRAAILDAALQVFTDRGYHQTSVSDLVDAAGVARGTFYQYFDSKKAIFLELIDRLATELRGSIVGVDQSDGAAPVPVQLVGTVERIFRVVDANHALTAILFREAVGLDDDVDARMERFYADLEAYIRTSLGNGQRVGIVRHLDTEVAAVCILGTLKEIARRYVLSDQHDLDVERVSREVVAFNLTGVLGR